MQLNETEPSLDGKWRSLAVLATGQLLVMGLWFSASAVTPQLQLAWGLEGGAAAWLTMSVQIGFVIGAVSSAALNLSDRVDARWLVAVSSLAGAGFTAAIALFAEGPVLAIALRVLTGIALAGVYPPGMKLMATWCKADRGLGIGLLVGALTFGSALPHLLNAWSFDGASGMPPWPTVLLSTSGLAVLGAGLVIGLSRTGPYLGASAPFDWRYGIDAFKHRPTRYANFGYLGHMWELYAMWTWAPFALIASYELAGLSVASGRVAGFAVIAIGAAGAVLAGVLADRMGRTTVAIASLAVSGTCALIAGLVFDSPLLLTVVCLVWGFAVVADSAQFSAAVSELSDPRYVGTALTVQTSLGFLLTLISIQIVPPLKEAVGWHFVFAFLAIGPMFGVWSMLKLRALPEAVRMASGNR